MRPPGPQPRGQAADNGPVGSSPPHLISLVIVHQLPDKQGSSDLPISASNDTGSLAAQKTLHLRSPNLYGAILLRNVVGRFAVGSGRD